MIDATAHAETTALHLAEILPDAPNAVRVRRSGAARNLVGELVGATEERVLVRVDVRPVRRSVRGVHGEAERGTVDIIAATSQASIEPGDLIDVGGVRYRVTQVTPIWLAGETHMFDIEADRLDIAPGSPV